MNAIIGLGVMTLYFILVVIMFYRIIEGKEW